MQGLLIAFRTFVELSSRYVGSVDDQWTVGFDPLTVCFFAGRFVLVCDVVVMLSKSNQSRQFQLRRTTHTSRRSGLRFLNAVLASFMAGPRAASPPELVCLILSCENTAQAVDALPVGAFRAAALRSRIVAVFFWSSVNTFFVRGFGLAFAVFARLGLALILGFAFGFALGMAFGAVVFGAGFLAAFVFEVVGAFLAAVVVLPVCALGRDTGFVAYVRHDAGFVDLSCSAGQNRLCNWELL